MIKTFKNTQTSNKQLVHSKALLPLIQKHLL